MARGKGAISRGVKEMRAIECRECGTKFQSNHHTKCFCSAPCRSEYNNRRRARGAELYDFVMSKRFEREHETDARGIIDALASGYREEDRRTRHSRKSWYDFRTALDSLPRLAATRDGR